MTESGLRSLVKTVSWRITGSSATFAVSYLVSGNFTMAGTIAVSQVVLNTALYYIHERIWNRIQWQKHS